MTTRHFYKWYDKLLTLLLNLLGFSSTFAFMACYAPPPEDLDYYVDQSELYFPSEGGERVINISGRGRWQISGIPSYISVTPMMGNGDSHVLVSACENYESASRSAILFVNSYNGYNNVSFMCIQEGRFYNLYIKPDHLTLSYEQSQKDSSSIVANGEWIVTQVPPFVEVYPTSGIGNGMLYVTTVTENNDSIDRNGLVMIVATDSYNIKSLFVTQQKK